MKTSWIDKMLKERPETPNILAPDWAGKWMDGDKYLFVAGPGIRSMAQNLIDFAADADGVLILGHLQEAKVLCLVRGGQKPDADGLLSRGLAKKTSTQIRILAAEADFFVTVNGDTWDSVDGLDDGEQATPEQLRRLHMDQVYKLQHELMHCTFAVGEKVFKCGRKKGWSAKDAFVRALGDECLGVEEIDSDHIAVRYVKRKKDIDGAIIRPSDVRKSGGNLKLSPRCWRVRKHDLQDFSDLMAQWGDDGLTMATLNRGIEKSKPQLKAEKKPA